MPIFGKGNTLNLIHQDGLPGYTPKAAISLTLDEEHRCLIFKARAFNYDEIRLPLSKVTFAGYLAIEEIEKQSKIGRAFVGGILFGSAGAIIGAMTAEEKKRNKVFYVINYESEGETKAIILQDNGSNLNMNKFQKALNNYLPTKEPGTVTL